VAVVELGPGEWQLRGCLGDEWRWHVSPEKAWDAPGWLAARVPGSVLDDLERAGEIAPLRFERNSRLAEWVPQRAWIYRRRFTVEGERGTIVFHGVDHEATVFVDGVEVGRHAGSFTPFDVEVAGGEHLLAVVVHAAPPSEPQVGETSRVRVHKSRLGNGWDFCPRLVHQGIWRPVTLWVDEPPREVVARATLEGSTGVVRCDGELTLLDGPHVVAGGRDELRVEGPELWWPNGFGEQRLYTLRAGGGEFAVGFRTVELADYRLRVNGREIPIRGWNWVPLDALYGVPRGRKLAQLLELAAGANVNLLRVWGGGLIETPEFYEHCDRLGLLVWQEFSQSSSGIESVPSDDPEFVALMEAEARAIVPRLVRHPSLAIWCGGNELDGDDSTPVLAALRDVVRELDPDRAWLPTSPLGEADVHGPWEHQGLAGHNGHYDSRTSKLHSEFGVEGMTNRAALDELVAPEHRWPADRTNPVFEHLGAWWNNAPLVQEAFGGLIRDVETMRRASQWLQYEGLRYAVEATLRRGAGTIPWQLNESFPNAWCTSAVDWHGVPKPAFWGVARAYRNAPSAQFATATWGGRDEARALVTTPARFVDLDGGTVAETDGGELAAPLDAFAHEVFLLDLEGRNRYVMTRTENLAPLLSLPPARVAVDGGRVRHVDGPAAIGLVLGDVIDLLPGEEREVAADAGVPEGWNVRA
jgi:beta-mannosidase